MKNIIEGYGSQYLKPTCSLLDELADGKRLLQVWKKIVWNLETKQARLK